MKIMLVAEKPSIGKTIKEILEGNIPVNDYFLDYTKAIVDVHNPIYGITKRADTYCLQYGKVYYDLSPISLKNATVPSHFLYSSAYRYEYINSDILSNMDEVISICDPDVEGVLKFAKYVEDHDLSMDKCKCAIIHNYSNKQQVMKAIENARPFSEIFQMYKDKGFEMDKEHYTEEDIEKE